MPLLNVQGVSISFPFQPYECQISYMEKVLQAVKQRQNAILESPTGTGKTLCLLCATLAWQEEFLANIQLARLSGNGAESSLHQDEKVKNLVSKLKSAVSQWEDLTSVPKIIFSSRTHAQLTQAIRALKTTEYSGRRVGIIGSRDQLCLNPEVVSIESNSGKMYQCRARVGNGSCEYYNNYEKSKESFTKHSIGNSVVDIEDLVKYGRQNRCCPYFMSRELKSNADIIFMPYNYLLDAKIRRMYNIDLQNAVIIFDEAHNIESVCEDSSSVDLTTVSLAGAIEELRCLGEQLHATIFENEENASPALKTNDLLDADGESPKLNLGSVLTLKGSLIELEEQIGNLLVPSNGLTKPGQYIYELLEKCGINFSNKSSILEIMDSILAYVVSSKSYKLKKGKNLSKIQDFLKTVLMTDFEGSYEHIKALTEAMNVCYRVHIQTETVAGSNNTASVASKVSWDDPSPSAASEKKKKVLSYWCFSPGRVMSELARNKVRSIILTSGTLYPIESLKTELGINFDIELKNPHVIQKDQVHVAILTKGVDGVPLNSNFENREKPAFLSSLGLTISRFAAVVPRGLLVFFPSYSLMKKCSDYWQKENIYNRIIQFKEVIVEPRDKMLFTETMEQYQRKVHDPNLSGGAALFAVARGKASEGLDLSDHSGRGVIIIGMPFPPAMDPKVKLKMAYLDERKCAVSGSMWYKQQAWKAINQAVGRVIRHHLDYGAVLLCDERFASSEARSNLPSWMQPSTKVYQAFEQVSTDLVRFYREANLKYPSKNIRTFHSAGNSSVTFSSTTTLSRNQSHSAISNAHTRRTVKRKMEDFPPAAFTERFSPSLKKIAVSDEKCLDDYRSTAAHPSAVNKESTSAGLLSLLNSVEGCSGTLAKTANQHGHIEDPRPVKFANLKRRLAEAEMKSKHIRVSSQANITPSGNKRAETYLSLVRELLKQDMTKYQETAREYKATGDVELLFKQMAQLFIPREAPGLLRDLYEFVRPIDQEKFRSLCFQLTGLQCESHQSKLQIVTPSASVTECPTSSANSAGTSMESNVLRCGECSKSPPNCPLAAPCKHVCCFPCWKTIIEQSSQRCPICKTMTRRRDLIKLVVK